MRKRHPHWSMRWGQRQQGFVRCQMLRILRIASVSAERKVNRSTCMTLVLQQMQAAWIQHTSWKPWKVLQSIQVYETRCCNIKKN
jgi:hypothetical protein